MHFQVIKDSYFNKIISRIKFCIPEFTSLFNEEDGVYLIMGELGSFIVNNINNKSIMQGSGLFINEAIEQGGVETEDAVVLQLFQRFYEYNDATSEIEILLSKKAKMIFDRYRQEHNILVVKK